MRFSVTWRDSDGDQEQKFEILDDALARGEELWESGSVLRVTVTIDQTQVVWERPIR